MNLDCGTGVVRNDGLSCSCSNGYYDVLCNSSWLKYQPDAFLAINWTFFALNLILFLLTGLMILQWFLMKSEVKVFYR